ncbi:MAG: DUF1549 and DUF1553 domain-containing protein [Planctomycetota bacterium]|nr:DUF1549 and DUF1553 domain-containing protein [Planctomycetota bacterium]
MRLILSGCATCLALCNAPISGQDEQAGGAQKTREQGSRVSQEDRQFWAFGPLRKITPPQPRDASWVRNPIDRFIRAAQERNGVSPSSAGTPQSLFRRASFGLTGLPPNADDSHRFGHDQSPAAWTAAIDAFLASPQYGERWARHWLDVARFAESHGFEQDYNRPHAYHYRDFVIRALNRDLPFDEFVRWQIAGDELAPEEPLARLATGFLGAGVFPTQLTEKEFERARYDELDDMVATIGASMLGLSIGCARCHDHKYDPIPASDYYQLLATFSTTIRSEVNIQMDPASDRQARVEWDKDHALRTADLALYERQQLPKRLAEFLTSGAAAQVHRAPGWQSISPSRFQSTGGASAKTQDDNSILVTGKNPRFDTYKVELETDAGLLTALRVEALPDASMPRRGPGRAVNGNFCLTNLSITAAPRNGQGTTINVPLTSAKATFSQRSLPVAAVIDANRKSGWAVDPQFGKPHAAVFEFAKPVGFAGGTRLTVELEFQCNTGHNIGRPRFSITGHPSPVPLQLEGPPPAVLAALAVPATSRSGADTKTLLTWFRHRDAGWLQRNKRIQEHAPPATSSSKVMICSEGHKPIKHHADGRGFPHFYESVHFLKRGDTNMKGPVVKPGFLRVLVRNTAAIKRWQVPPPAKARTSHRRAAVARWLTDVEDGAGALLARVIVNRVWHHHFGTGIVATPNDFGNQGARPSHPDLLDWLAGELIRGGWRLKPIHRLIMTSASYRQGDQSGSRADLTNIDKWFGRYRPRRLEGESLRDALLQVAGVLDPRMFGAGTLDEANNRRSIYFMIKRSKLIPMMVTFDLPEPLTSQGQRTTTTVAPQALLLMNSAHVRRYATAFAKLVGKASDPITTAYRRALGRSPSADEHRAGKKFLASQANSYQEAGQGGAHSLALVDFCQVLFGLNEFAYVH